MGVEDQCELMVKAAVWEGRSQASLQLLLQEPRGLLVGRTQPASHTRVLRGVWGWLRSENTNFWHFLCISAALLEGNLETKGNAKSI